ncbi:hypothetical protein QBC37DRAFT_465041 [Rhypophila decipiens]|uniref:Uncharacterized protein n=1 Tax=Rhypophila decipiens TaxID=261697 RepID=A0AAN6Y7M4_9PEZI|nr:hypothetical protein QBC37DRAFT_465041 [Rhypophila decipiens]
MNFVTEKRKDDGSGYHSAAIDTKPSSMLAVAYELSRLAKENKDIVKFKIDITPISEQDHEMQRESVRKQKIRVDEKFFCANCECVTHKLRTCPKPDPEHGGIPGCPNCNTLRHTFDDCYRTKSWFNSDGRLTHQGIKQLVDLIEARANKPWIQSGDCCFLSVLADFHYGSESNRHYAEKGTLPWTHGFSKRMAVTQVGDPALQGKYHWSQWHEPYHRLQDLPTDTAYLDAKGDCLPLPDIYAKHVKCGVRNVIDWQTANLVPAPASTSVKAEYPESTNYAAPASVAVKSEDPDME